MIKTDDTFMFVYWGRKGGGLRLFEDFISTAESKNLRLLTSCRPTLKNLKGQLVTISPLNVFGWVIAREKLVASAKARNVRCVVFVMASPWDLFLGRRLKRCGIEVVRIIHDATPHPGDFFPSRSWIRLLLRDCSRIIVLSRYVGAELTDIYGIDPSKITSASIPYPLNTVRSPMKMAVKQKILLVGRGKKYQGQDLMEKTWSLLEIPNTRLVIAGKGFKANDKINGVEYKIGWLSDEDMIFEIRSSSLVVLPYMEGSQSGIIPMCTSLGIPVVVTPVGGLPEQVVNGETGLVVDDVTPEALAQGISEILSKNLIIPPVNPQQSQWELVRKSIGIGDTS